MHDAPTYVREERVRRDNKASFLICGWCRKAATQARKGQAP